MTAFMNSMNMSSSNCFFAAGSFVRDWIILDTATVAVSILIIQSILRLPVFA